MDSTATAVPNGSNFFGSAGCTWLTGAVPSASALRKLAYAVCWARAWCSDEITPTYKTKPSSVTERISTAAVTRLNTVERRFGGVLGGAGLPAGAASGVAGAASGGVASVVIRTPVACAGGPPRRPTLRQLSGRGRRPASP